MEATFCFSLRWHSRRKGLDMASASFAPDLTRHRPIPLAEIDAAVSARLGATRGLGNSQSACFNRQVAMYLAKTVGGWTTTVIGRFYNGRDHSTVCYGIQRIEALRESDPDVDALITSLKNQFASGGNSTMANADINVHRSAVRLTGADLEKLAELIATRVCAIIQNRRPGQESDISEA